MTPQQWWWLAHQAATSPPMKTTPGGTPIDDMGHPIEGATLPSHTSPRAQGPPDMMQDTSDPDIEPSPIPFSTQPAPEVTNKWGDFTPRTDVPLSGPPSLPDIPFENLPTNDFSPAPQIDQYVAPEFSNPPPDEEMMPGMFPMNLSPNEGMYPESFGTLSNPEPNETTTPGEIIPFQNPEPNEEMFPRPITPVSNPPPDESMIASPISELSNPPPDEKMTATPIDNYFPDGQGGYIVYDENWQPTDQVPSTEGVPQAPTDQGAPSGQDIPAPAGIYDLVPPPELQDVPAETPTASRSLPGNLTMGMPIAGATFQLGAHGGNTGTFGNMLFRGIWGGKSPYTQENYNNLLGFMNYNRMPGGMGMSYNEYVSLWNQLRAGGRTDPNQQTGIAATNSAPAEATSPPMGSVHAATQ